MQHQDVIVVGGGMVGSAAALGLAQAGYKVTLLEQRMPKAYQPEQPPDIRVSAISLGSERLLEQLGAWQYVKQMRSRPYRRLAVWEEPVYRTEFNGSELGHEHLGHLLENRILQLALHQALADTDVQILTTKQWRLSQLHHLEDQQGQVIQADWCIGADGGQSQVRQQAGIGVTGWQYQQHALAILIEIDGPEQDITWQQFTPTGPQAFLPLYDKYACLVWYHQADKVQALSQLTNEQLKQQVIAHFPPLPGPFEVLEHGRFPLTRQHAQQYIADDVMLLGDAAHVINPLAGQGVNLGFKDVTSLLDLIEQFDARDPAQRQQLFQRYQRIRRPDNLLMSCGMDGFYQLFSQNTPLLKVLRNGLLGATGHCAPLRKRVMGYALGL